MVAQEFTDIPLLSFGNRHERGARIYWWPRMSANLSSLRNVDPIFEK